MNQTEHPKGSCLTTVENLKVSERGVAILKGVSLTLPCGCFAALIGPNGAGKSTLIRSLIGEVRYEGLIRFNGKKALPRIGYVSQKMFFEADNPCTVADLFWLVFGKTPIWWGGRGRLKQRLSLLEELKSVKVEQLIDRPLSALSGGELRRVFLALALADRPQILLLDEPGTGLDQNGIELFYQMLANIRREYDLSILMVSHNFNLVKQYADYTYLLSDGQLVDQGCPNDVFVRQPFTALFK